jgi:hypothetical protein
MVDYRGYGKSSGRIESEAQLRADVLAAWQDGGSAIRRQAEGDLRPFPGHSARRGLAAEVQPDLTILVSPYCDMAQLMAYHYPALADRTPALSSGDLP